MTKTDQRWPVPVSETMLVCLGLAETHELASAVATGTLIVSTTKARNEGRSSVRNASTLTKNVSVGLIRLKGAVPGVAAPTRLSRPEIVGVGLLTEIVAVVDVAATDTAVGVARSGIGVAPAVVSENVVAPTAGFKTAIGEHASATTRRAKSIVVRVVATSVQTALSVEAYLSASGTKAERAAAVGLRADPEVKVYPSVAVGIADSNLKAVISDW